MRKTYISPTTQEHFVETATVMVTSVLDHESDNPSVTPTDDPYDGEFSSRRRQRTVWDDEEEEY